jgi:hypothetical protein
MSSTPPKQQIGINNVLSFNGHGGKVTGKPFNLPIGSNVYILVPFGDGVDLPSGQTKTKTDMNFKGLDVCYGFPKPDNTSSGKSQSFEEIIYGDPGKLKLTFNNGSTTGIDATWHLYRPGDDVPNVSYFAWKQNDKSANAVPCDVVENEYDPFVSDLMKECRKSSKNVCAYFVSDSTKTDTTADPGKRSGVFIDKDKNHHLKLKICGNSDAATTTLKDLAENCRDMVNFSREYVLKNNGETQTYKGYTDENIFPKSGPTDPIILLPFSCNSGSLMTPPVTDIELFHTNAGDTSAKPLSKIIADLSGGGGGGGGSAPVGSDKVITGKVAQFFMTFLSSDKTNGGLSGYGQCRKIVNAVKCLMDKGYKHIGLTYSANQQQTIKIWKEYNYPDANDFDDKQEKTILQTGIGGTNQAQTIGIHNKQEKKDGVWVDIEPLELTTHIDDLTSKPSDENSKFKKAFRIIPFSTMAGGGGTTEVNLGSPGDIDGCIKAATEFLKLPDSIILGWCNQDIETLTDSNKDSFNKDYKPADASKLPFAIGGGVGGKSKLPLLFGTYLGQYFKFLTSVWDKDVQKIVTDCSPNPTSADATGSLPSKPPAKSAQPKASVEFAKVLTDLQAKITLEGDSSADITTLTIKDPGLFYPTTEPISDKKKNLNCATPLITDMIDAFETASTDDATKTTRDFYLGACRSIEAAYKLDETEAGVDDNKKIRAKLLLNLRKNSLLLKVPRRWNYATMALEKVKEPPANLPGLMDYSLEETIEYYSQAGGDQETQFKKLNIAENPRDMIVSGVTISSVDGRFVKGIESGVGQACFFVTCLQYLMCNEDFLQLMIEGNCNTESIKNIEMDKKVNKDTGAQVCIGSFDKNKTFINNLLLFFKKWINDQTIDNDQSKPLYELYKIIFHSKPDSDYRYGKQEDSTEVLGDIVNNLDCLNNIYVKKFLNNGVMYDITQKTSLVGGSIDGVSIDEVQIVSAAGSEPINPPGFDSYPKAETDPSYKDLKKQDGNFYSVQDTINNNTENQPFVLNLDNLNKFDLRKRVYDLFSGVLGVNKTGLDKQTLFGILHYLLYSNVKIIDDDFDNFINIYKGGNQINLDVTEKDKQSTTTDIFKNYLHVKDVSTQQVKLNGDATNVTYPTDYPDNPEQCKPNKTFNNITSRTINFEILYPVLNSMIKKLNSKLKGLDISTKENIENFINDENNKYLIFMIYLIITDFISVILCPYKPDGTTYEIKKETIRNFGKYIMFYYKRTSWEVDPKNNEEIKYKYGIDINETITSLSGQKYFLVGFTCHYGGTSKSGHYDCVKCDKKGKPILGISDNTISIYSESETIKRGVVAVIYKRADELGQAGGGRFKPMHNTITNHTAYKSKHNSSFKVSSSSKSKHKGHNRSHTQRVK